MGMSPEQGPIATNPFCIHVEMIPVRRKFRFLGVLADLSQSTTAENISHILFSS